MTESSLLATLLDKVTTRYAADSLGTAMQKYKDDPSGFARNVLGSTWWSRQEDIARALVTHRRVAVKSANGVGKTYLAADLALWFLYTQQPAIVLTTAPTWRQVRFQLWEEIRRRFHQANSPKLGGRGEVPPQSKIENQKSKIENSPVTSSPLASKPASSGTPSDSPPIGPTSSRDSISGISSSYSMKPAESRIQSGPLLTESP